jgi:hypothetical protein
VSPNTATAVGAGLPPDGHGYARDQARERARDMTARILALFRQDPRPMSIGEISRALGEPVRAVSTAARRRGYFVAASSPEVRPYTDADGRIVVRPCLGLCPEFDHAQGGAR